MAKCEEKSKVPRLQHGQKSRRPVASGTAEASSAFAIYRDSFIHSDSSFSGNSVQSISSALDLVLQVAS